MTDNVTHLPEPGVILDLDAETRPDEAKPPFVAKIGGKNVTFIDPSEIDWRDLASVEIPADMIRVSLSPDDLAHVQTTSMKAWQFNKLMESYYTHYDLASKIRDAQRQQQFGR